MEPMPNPGRSPAARRGAPRPSAASLGAVLLASAVLAACTPGRLVEPAAAAESAPAGNSATPEPASSAGFEALRTVRVSTAPELHAALGDARPGDRIDLADGSYRGRFRANVSGTARLPILLCGSRGAVIRTGSIDDDGYAVVVAASHWTVEGITITESQQGIKTFGGSHNVFRSLHIHGIGQEAVKFHGFSSHNTLENSRIRDTGRFVAEYGEGVYLGSWRGHWDEYSGGRPDASDGNRVVGNTFGPDVRAEHVDAKEGTSGGTIEGNTFIGTGMVRSRAWVDSWVEITGSRYTVAGNHGVHSLRDGFQVTVGHADWGHDNVFRDNVADVRGPGVGFRVSREARGTVVACSNRVLEAVAGFANVECR